MPPSLFLFAVRGLQLILSLSVIVIGRTICLFCSAGWLSLLLLLFGSVSHSLLYENHCFRSYVFLLMKIHENLSVPSLLCSSFLSTYSADTFYALSLSVSFLFQLHACVLILLSFFFLSFLLSFIFPLTFSLPLLLCSSSGRQTGGV